MSELKLRTESIKDEEIEKIAVLRESDKKIIEHLVSSEPCLLEGSRGTGKSFLMKIAQLELEQKRDTLPIFISFNMSSLINTDDSLQFYHWMLAKTIRALLNKLIKDGAVISDYSNSLLSNYSESNSKNIKDKLKDIIRSFEMSYKDTNKCPIELNNLPDIEDVKEAITEICRQNKLTRVVFFFDEAAHVFRPEQQRQFFNLFKDLRSSYITCNAAIYPGVTHFGNSFELTHDCSYQVLDRSVTEEGYLDYFYEMFSKQSDNSILNVINNNKDIFNTLVYSCSGNPRILFKTYQSLTKLNTNEVNKEVKDFYRNKIWSEHTELGEKYKGHKELIDWGRDFLEQKVIPTVNENKKSTIYFWIDKDVPETVKESLRLLTYTGIIKKIDSTNRAHGKIGTRYEIKYGCIIALAPNPHQSSKEIFNKISIRQFTKFGAGYKEYDKIKDIIAIIENDKHYKKSLESILAKPITVLTLTEWQIKKLMENNITTIRDLHTVNKDDLLKIHQIGEKRSETMIKAMQAELLEYISG
ncbi:helix-hairpin-helix domain-containing protein [Halobacteriovorax sp. HFRX-2_2]|uniref:helix-hairpin-helix domain-containing protein n=1 Tax=unclassified Halobacteriovorax TaxID=2639665 RepID=UPI00371AC577